MILDLPALTTPLPKETLFIYLATSKKAVSEVLVVVRKGERYPVHYVSRMLHDAERNYASLEKMALTLRHVSRRLRRYFEAHPITVITNRPIKQILSKADTSVSVGSETMVPRQTQYTIDRQKDCKEKWVLYTYGAPNIKGSGACLVLVSPTKTEYTYALRLNFESTNNQAEYEALLAGLRIAKKIGVQSLSVNVDSKLVASQINGNYEACKENMIRYLSKAKEYITFNHLTKEILVKTLDVPLMDVEEINAVVEEEGETWMTPFINCLERGVWPEDQNEARALRMKIGQYVMEEGVLFKKSYLMPMLRCVGPLQANYVFREIHTGACNMHPKARPMVAKAI
ncbi:reverse transcriptase domain-containing protein [Tanacetum coccineum]